MIDLKFIPLDWLKNILASKQSINLSTIIDKRILLLLIGACSFAVVVVVSNLIAKGMKILKLEIFLQKIKKMLFFNVFLRYLITAYLKLFVNQIEAIKDKENNVAVSDSQKRLLSAVPSIEAGQVEASAPFRSLALTFSMFMLAYIPFGILGFLQHNLPNLHKVEFKQRIESLYLGLKLTPLGMTYPSVF